MSETFWVALGSVSTMRVWCRSNRYVPREEAGGGALTGRSSLAGIHTRSGRDGWRRVFSHVDRIEVRVETGRQLAWKQVPAVGGRPPPAIEYLREGQVREQRGRCSTGQLFDRPRKDGRSCWAESTVSAGEPTAMKTGGRSCVEFEPIAWYRDWWHYSLQVWPRQAPRLLPRRRDRDHSGSFRPNRWRLPK